MLHVLNGDATREIFEQTGLDGEVCVFADVLHEGPLLADPTDAAFTEARIRHAVEAGWGPPDVAAAHYASWVRGLNRAAEHDEIVLWFEHDLYDQLLLLHHLEWFARRGWLGGPRPLVSIICIGSFEGIPDFAGLGQLSPDQLASLLPARQPVGERQRSAARGAWAALTSADPRGLENAAAQDDGSLPFLAGALRRLLEDYPHTGSGLSRTELQILRALRDGPRSPAQLFRAQAEAEERVFLGDATFWGIVQQLLTAPTPTLEADVVPHPERALPDGSLALTDFGRDVLMGHADATAINGADRWIGGVRVHGTGFPWRWDPASARLVERV